MVKFKYYQSTKDDLWYWRLRDGNNKIVADGAEGYSSEQAVKRAIENVKNDIKDM